MSFWPHVSLFVALLGVLVAATWRLGRILGRFEVLQQQLAASVGTIAAIERDVAMLKDSVAAYARRERSSVP